MTYYRARSPHIVYVIVLLTLAALLLASCDSNTSPTQATSPVTTTTAVSAAVPGPIFTATTAGASIPESTPTIAAAETAQNTPPVLETPSTAPVVVNDITPTGKALPTGPVVDVALTPIAPPTQSDNAPGPTAVTATGTGADITALQGLALLKPRALAWQPDARLGMLSNVRPGQQKNLLAGALGDPNTNEPTPGGHGRNWSLLAFSPSSGGAMAFSMDGSQVDLVKEGTVPGDVVRAFADPDLGVLSLKSLDVSRLVDSDKIVQKAGARAQGDQVGIALLAPNGLGTGPLPTPQAGGQSPQLAYQIFSSDPNKQIIIFFDAQTGAVVLDSAAP